MNKIYFLLCWFLLPVLLHSQAEITSPGDVFYFQLDKAPNKKSIPEKGTVKFWDFAFLESGLTHSFKSASIVNADGAYLPTNSNLQMSSSLGPVRYYETTRTTFANKAYAGEDPFGIGYQVQFQYTNAFDENIGALKVGKVLTEVAETSILYSMDNIREDFIKRLPFLADSIRLNILISRKNTVDGYGRLYLPDFDYPDCKRVSREETYDYTIDIKTGNQRWTDATKLFEHSLNKLPAQRTQVLFYHPRQLLPVLTLRLNWNGRSVEQAMYKALEKKAPVKSTVVEAPEMSVFPNPAYTRNIKVEFNNIPVGRYTFKLYSLIGKLEKAVPYYLNDTKFDTIDISDLKPGIYIYALVNSSGKIIISKRLTIITP